MPSFFPILLLAACSRDAKELNPAADVVLVQSGEVMLRLDDEIGQFVDTDNGAFDHLEFYPAEARRLAALGF